MNQREAPRASSAPSSKLPDPPARRKLYSKMPTYKDIRCTIRVNHKTLREYKDEDDDQSPATKTVYVQAREAETFSIRCKVLPDYEPAVGDRVSFRVYIAGKECCRKSINIVGGHRHKHLNLQGAYGVDDGGNEFVHPFQFAGVSLGMPYLLFFFSCEIWYLVE